MKAKTKKLFEVYRYADENLGWGYAAPVRLIWAKDEDEARKIAEGKKRPGEVSYWYCNDIHEIKAPAKYIAELKANIAFYERLLKEAEG